MGVDFSRVQPGMDVYGRDDEKIGQVAGIVTSQTGGSGYDTGDAGGATADYEPNTYLRVEYSGFLGTGARTIFVPSVQVAEVVPGERVTLQCVKDACLELYAETPPGVS
ncbi:MAG: hypothetical protein JOZ41_16635 [Chloroflexi bacterium]|nr:hypothetical protein [Chloroflexota bacterium]